MRWSDTHPDPPQGGNPPCPSPREGRLGCVPVASFILLREGRLGCGGFDDVMRSLTCWNTAKMVVRKS